MCFVGVDIGGTYIKYGILENDKLFLYDKVKTSELSGVKELINHIDGWLKLNKKKDKIKGIGIGAPNANYYKGRIENAPNLKWGKNVELKTLFSKHFSIPVIVHNDANAAALAEKYFGGAKQLTDFIVLTLGTGVGSGIFVNNKLLLGTTGFAGEFGHTSSFTFFIRKCTCNRYDCIEEYISERGLINNYKLLNNKSKKLKLTGELIYKKAREGDKTSQEALQLTGIFLGLAFSNIINIFNPQAIFITGGIARAHKYILPIAKSICKKNVLPVFRNTYKITLSHLQKNSHSGVLGSIVPFLTNEYI